MITLFPQTTFSGTWTSNAVLVPHGGVTAILQAAMNPGDISTPGWSVGLCIGQMLDYRTVGHGASNTWQSGGSTGPYLAIQLSVYVQSVTGQMIVPQPLSIGLTLDILDAMGNSLFISTPSGSGVAIPVPVVVPNSGSLF